MDDWIERYADALGVERPSPEEVGAVLRLAREVAHGAERKLAPLAAYLTGVAAGRVAERASSVREALEAARDLLPPPEPRGQEGPGAGPEDGGTS